MAHSYCYNGAFLYFQSLEFLSSLTLNVLFSDDCNENSFTRKLPICTLNLDPNEYHFCQISDSKHFLPERTGSLYTAKIPSYKEKEILHASCYMTISQVEHITTFLFSLNTVL